MLLKANWKDGRFKGVEVKRGQFISGRKTLAEETSLSERQVRTAITRLKSTNELTSKTTKAGTLFSIINYSTYQDLENNIDQANDQANDHRATSKRPSIDQASTTIEEREEDKKENNIPPIIPQGDGVEIAKSDWDAFCRKYQIQGIPLMPDLSDRVTGSPAGSTPRPEAGSKDQAAGGSSKETSGSRSPGAAGHAG